MKARKLLVSLVTLLLTLSMLMSTAFAARYALDDATVAGGGIRVVADASGTKVYDYDNNALTGEDDGNDGVTIYQKDPGMSTTNAITLESEDGKTVEVTIEDLYIESDSEMGYEETEYPLIDVVNGSKAVIIVKGNNLLELYNAYDDQAILHVGSGDLTIKGDGSLTVYGDASGAKIGSHEEEDFTGTIHITDDVKVRTSDDGSNDGAAIGSGQYGDFVGTVKIDGKAIVSAKSNDRGAGIGAGEGMEIYNEADEYIGTEKGDFRGTVIIEGNAVVIAEGDDDSAGIGNGENGSFSGGSITIGGNAMVIAEGSSEGPAIGAAYDTSMDGTITIQDNALVLTIPGDDAPDIGNEGYNKSQKGFIFIKDNAQVYRYARECLVIGGDYSDSEIGIYIDETVNLNGYSLEEILNGDAEGKVLINSVYGINQKSLTQKEPAFRIYGEDGNWMSYVSKVKGDTLIVTVEGDYAKLMGEQTELMELKKDGINRIRLVTDKASCEMDLDTVIENSQPWEKIALILDGKRASLTIGGVYRGELLD